MSFKDLFQKRKYATVPTERTRREIPDGLMNKCSRCGAIQFSKELEKNLKVCSSCNYHMRLNGLERIQMILDEDTFVEYLPDLIAGDPLQFPGYPAKLAKHQQNTGFKDAVLTGEGTIDGNALVIAAMSFEFFGGSMGSVVGEKISHAIEQAITRNVPFVLFSTSGGARMEESILSLMQMAKTSALLSRFAEQKGLFISVLTDPTLGGVTASFAMLGDINIAEPGAIVGFTGRRVIEQTIRQNLPDNFQTAEFNMKHGQLDMVVPRKELRNTISKLLEMHTVVPARMEG